MSIILILMHPKVADFVKLCTMIPIYFSPDLGTDTQRTSFFVVRSFVCLKMTKFASIGFNFGHLGND